MNERNFGELSMTVGKPYTITLGRNKDQPLDDDRFLQTHYLVYFGKSIIDDFAGGRTQRAYRKYSRVDYASDLLDNRFIPKNVIADAKPDAHISLSDIYRYVSSLQEAVEIWYKMYNPFSSDFSTEVQVWLDKLNCIGMDMVQYLVLVFLQRVSAESKRFGFLQALERYLFIVSLGGGSFYRAYPYIRFGNSLFSVVLDFTTLELAYNLNIGKLSGDKVTLALNDETNPYRPEVPFMSEKFRSVSDKRVFINGSGFGTSYTSTNLGLQRRYQNYTS